MGKDSQSHKNQGEQRKQFPHYYFALNWLFFLGGISIMEYKNKNPITTRLVFHPQNQVFFFMKPRLQLLRLLCQVLELRKPGTLLPRSLAKNMTRRGSRRMFRVHGSCVG